MTLLSIVLCLILGTIVGVTRLSSNKLASTMATVYVEVFRNLPLAVLLFLIATQFGIQAPLFIEETFLSWRGCFLQQSGHLVRNCGILPKTGHGISSPRDSKGRFTFHGPD
ncbi:MAG: ABC transporter permease subunit [Candidatus Thalassarchaeaceae archaeon]